MHILDWIISTKLLIAIILISFLLTLLLFNFKKVVVYLLSRGSLVKNKANVALSQNACWFDDYYTIEYLDHNTIAIGEPRYWQKNYSYLIIGSEKAILFDSGPGIRNIEPVVRSLTSLPVISMCSHFHYDHIGSINDFETTLFCTNQLTNQLVDERRSFVPTQDSFLGKAEGYPSTTIHINDTVEPNSVIALGGRTIHVIPTPGHAKNSISLLDKDSNQLFVGDFLVPAILLTHSAFVPDGSLVDTLESTNSLIDLSDEKTEIYCGHNANDILPVLTYSDLIDLSNISKESSLTSGLIPKYKKINQSMSIIY